MFIYIDESGSFSHPQRDEHAYACAGALTLPERTHGKILKTFKTLCRRWGRTGEEVKGRELDEKQVRQVIEMLVACRAKFHACVTDMALTTKELLDIRKKVQAEHLLANITDQHHPNLVRQLRDLGERLREMPDQLFVQLCVMTQLINAHLHDAMIFFANDAPEELISFRWVVDRKNDKETSYEATWRTLLTPFIHGRQFSDHFEDKIFFLKGGNYEYCARFFQRLDQWPDHLPEQKPGLREKTGIHVVDIRPILQESFSLRDSHSCLGLQLADVVTNALRRALIGNLQPEGWSDMGRLMIRWEGQCVKVVHFGDGHQKPAPLDDEYAARVIMRINDRAGFVL